MSGLSWDRFADVMVRVVPDLPGDFGPDTKIDEFVEDGLRRVVIRLAIKKVGRGLPDELVSSITSFGEGYDWCAEKWVGEEFPADLLEAEVLPENSGSRVRLRPVRPSDIPMLYEAALHPDSSFRWRFRGATPSGPEFERALYDGTHAQFIVEDRASRTAHGLVASYNVRHDNGTAWIAFHRTNFGPASGQLFEGLFLFVDYLFRTWNLRKLYGEIPDYNFREISSVLSGFARVEGRFVGHEYHDGEWWDLVTVAVHREAWEELASVWRRFMNSPTPGSP